MFGTGTFAQIAKISPRTLRHYDNVGLLKPAEVNAETGYRFYRAAQLPRLNRILALKDLGFTLDEIANLLETGIDAEEMVGMLRLRRAEAERVIESEQRRLSRVATRIQLLGQLVQGDIMNEAQTDVVVKALDAVRLAVVSEPAADFDVDFGPIFDRLYPQLFAELGRLGVPPIGVSVALYDERSDGTIDVIAGVPIPAEADIDSPTVSARALEGEARAATLVHAGEMAEIKQSYASLETWIEQEGERAIGFSRELYLDCDGPQADWVTEIQFVLA